MTNPIKTVRTVKVFYDYNAVNPRADTDTKSKIILLKHRARKNWEIADEMEDDERGMLESIALDLGELSQSEIYNATDEELEAHIKKYAVMLPIYIYEHSGFAFRTAQTTPSSGARAGIIYEARADDDKYDEAILEGMRGEVKLLEVWANGEVYGFKVMEQQVIEQDGRTFTDNAPVEVDACWGFYGSDHEESGLATALADNNPELVPMLKDIQVEDGM